MEHAHNGEGTGRPVGEVDVPWNLVVPTVDIHLVGYGNRLPNDFTLELLGVLQRCRRIFGAPPIKAPEFNIPEMESLLTFYGAGKRRTDTYREIADHVLAAAAADPPVALATYGSVMVGSLAPHIILEEAPKRGLKVHVTNAVSCFDGLWADFNMEPFYGFEVWEATSFVNRGIEPNTSANLMLPQAPMLDVTVGVDPEALTMEVSSTVARLRDHLLKFYPPDHTVHFVATSSGAGDHLFASDIESLKLSDLDHPGRHQASTLVVPRGSDPGRGQFDFESATLTQTPIGESA
ncbi:MAG: hypothetical protein QOH61_2569 [Chloroflexota bacterium]|jgi:uncharacterized protein YabN with tetrapyrrole methylase and pyrophosphatase domain|nr:hypothetical protein [Chloroflexota bacterium]